MLHRYQHGGKNIVMDIYSGAIHVMDDVSYTICGWLNPEYMPPDCPTEMLVQLSEFSTEEVLEAYGELYSLYQQGQLFASDDYDSIEAITALSPVKAMCLHIAHDCNMRCEYCFASTGDYDGGRCLMSFEVAKAAIDYLLHHSKGRRNLEVDFFGGEPLMNFDVVKQTVEYARSKQEEYQKVFRFTITTNGLLLTDDKIDFINREMSNVVLSIDGRREVHDKVRALVNQNGSGYDIIIPKMQKLVSERGDQAYYARGTFTKYNLDFAEDVVALSELGFDQLSVEPVVSSTDAPYAITETELPAIFAEYERLAEIMLERSKQGNWFNFFHFMIDLEQGPCAIKRLRGCGCGNEYVAITPQGDVYPCHQFVGHPEWVIGSVFDKSIDIKTKERFAKATVYGKEDCKHCWAKFYCSGGCNANGLLYAGDILKPHNISCELEKKRVECAIYIKVCEAE